MRTEMTRHALSRALRGNQRARKLPKGEGPARLVVLVPAELIERIERAAEARQCSRADIVREILARNL